MTHSRLGIEARQVQSIIQYQMQMIDFNSSEYCSIVGVVMMIMEGGGGGGGGGGLSRRWSDCKSECAINGS